MLSSCTCCRLKCLAHWTFVKSITHLWLIWYLLSPKKSWITQWMFLFWVMLIQPLVQICQQFLVWLLLSYCISWNLTRIPNWQYNNVTECLIQRNCKFTLLLCMYCIIHSERSPTLTVSWNLIYCTHEIFWKCGGGGQLWVLGRYRMYGGASEKNGASVA